MMTQNNIDTSDPVHKFNALNLPVHRASTLVFESTEAFLSRKSQLYDGYSYGLYGTPTTRALEDQVAQIEGGLRSILLPSGLAALTHTLLTLVQSGDQVLVADCVYGPVREFCASTLGRLGVTVDFLPAGADSIAPFLTSKTRIVVLESPGSFTMEIQDIATICAEAHRREVRVMLDNTWGFGNASMFQHGVDIVCTALSKYASGHSDVCMGSITVSDDALYRKLKKFVSGVGSGVSSDDAYLVSRGLSTLEIRLREHQIRGLELARWLRARTEVERVINPADPEDPYHERYDKYFTGGNGLVSFVLKCNALPAIARMLDGFKYFKIGASWGGTSSLVALADLSGIRSLEQFPKETYVLRIHIGLEPLEALYADLDAGFGRFNNAP